MKKEPKIFIKHILECITYIEKFTKSIKRTEFKNSTLIQDSVIRKLEIIGEAANNIPKNFQELYPTIPWSKMISMRNILIHNYFEIDLDIVWRVVKIEIPKLKKEILKIKL